MYSRAFLVFLILILSTLIYSHQRSESYSRIDIENNEEAVLTAVLRKYDGVWKVVQGQRSTGREPKLATPCNEKKKMENEGIISEADSYGRREILLTEQNFDNI